MSQSPTVSSSMGHDEYLSGWRALSAMVREGLSFSGLEPHCCFLNTGGERFANISSVAGLDFPDDGRGVAVVDWDLDGALDLWLSNRTGPRIRFMHNRGVKDNRFVQLELTGRSCNRDAIGARVELFVKGDERQPRIHTIRAGEGFLSQSSKRVHFGLGAKDEPERVVVRWPGGDTEAFRGLKAGRRYSLVQGEGLANLLPAPTGSVRLAPSTLKAPPVSDRARIVLAARVPVPKLSYRKLDGDLAAMNTSQGSPRLVNLWASWCPSCVTELGSFAEHAEQIRASGLSILALSVDESDSQEAARTLLKKVSWPFESGFVSEDLVAVLDTLQRALLERSRPLPVPASFLLDREDRIAVIYKGPISSEVLLADVADLENTTEQRHAAAAGFPGRWLGQPHRVNLSGLAREFNANGLTEVALQYFEAGSASAHQAPVPADPARKRDLANVQHHMGFALCQQGKVSECIAAMERAVEIDPTYWWAHRDLAIWMNRAGRREEAISHGRSASALNPASVEIKQQLSMLLIEDEDFPAALSVIADALKLEPANDVTVYLYGLVSFYTGNRAEAERQVEVLQSLNAASAEKLRGILQRPTPGQ